MINTIFRLCVSFLVWLAGKIGMSYEAVNVWIFCIIWPALTLGLIVFTSPASFCGGANPGARPSSDIVRLDFLAGLGN